MGEKRSWFRARPTDDEMREELESHVAMRAAHDRVDEAVARRRLGNTLRTRERMRRVWVAEWWDALRQDAHYTWRSWRRRPAFALAAVLVLGLGLGASAALFAALDRLLFRPLPYADPDRLVSVGFVMPQSVQIEAMADKPYVQMWDTPPAPFESVTATGVSRDCDIGEEPPERVRCATVDDNFLRVLGVRVAEGRDFAPGEDVRGTPPVALISHRLWVRRYGSDPRAIGRILSLDSPNAPVQRAAIAGVLPPDFEMPLETADILLPLQMRPLPPGPFMSPVTAFARLEPDVTSERAERMLVSQLPELMAFMPAVKDVAWRVRPLRDRRVGDAARVGWLLVAAVAAFLLIACVNVSNLMLARVAERQREFAVRAAVGAGTIRLARLAFAESLLLSFAAGGVGLLVASGLLSAFVAMAPSGLPGIVDASIDVRVFVVAVALVVLTGMAIGIWPAISVFRAGSLPGLRSTSSSPGAGPRVRFALVTTQIALTLALLGGSALLLRSLWNVVSIPLGFDAERVVTMSVGLSATRYPAPAHRSAFFEELLARARTTPGAVSAALSSAPAPLGTNPWPGDGSVVVEGRPVLPEPRHDPIRFREVTSDYFETLRIPLIGGATFEDIGPDGGPVVVLNESAARILLAGEPALGRRIRGIAFHAAWHTVVGIATDVRNGEGITEAPLPEAYVIAPRDRWPGVAPGSASAHLVLRTAASPADADAFLRRIAADLDPLLLPTIQTVDEQVARLSQRPRFIAWLLTAFAALALLLAASGLYSVASYLVAQRRRDIGLRIAIGAAPRDVARQVVGEACRWIAAGTLLGCALGWAGTRALQSQLYNVPALDPWSWAAALVSLALVLLAAVFRPAHHAAHVDPIAALRAE
jgi:predicted permease